MNHGNGRFGIPVSTYPWGSSLQKYTTGKVRHLVKTGHKTFRRDISAK